jgi:hypothetical protein
MLTKDKNEESRQNLIRLNNILSNVINGLSNLMQTYNYDKLTQSSIEVMINTIRNKLNLQLKHIHYVYDENIIHKNNITNSSSSASSSSSVLENQSHNMDDSNEKHNEKLSNSLTLSTNNNRNENYKDKEKDTLDTHNSSNTNINNNASTVSQPKKKKFHT